MLTAMRPRWATRRLSEIRAPVFQAGPAIQDTAGGLTVWSARLRGTSHGAPATGPDDFWCRNLTLRLRQVNTVSSRRPR